jgi:hypothetical protein
MKLEVLNAVKMYNRASVIFFMVSMFSPQSRNKGRASGALTPGAVHVGVQNTKIRKLTEIKFLLCICAINMCNE